MNPIDPVWDELGKIDYLLDQLARAVERGDIGLAVYDRLAPAYLAKRAVLVDRIEGRSTRAEAPMHAAPSAARPAPAPATQLPHVEVPPRAYARRVSAGAWMTYAGAFLVVVAAAIFTIYAWGSMPPIAKLAVLAAVTVGFYMGGEVVRTRLELPAVGVALIGVGSAMLLFDGWAVINGFGLSGVMPWAVLLLLCSLAYWATEVRIAGGWFGAVGAVSQIGWWWLLTDAVGLGAEWRLAGIAIVAAAWMLGGERVGPEGPLAVLGTILRRGAPIVAAFVTVLMLGAGPDAGGVWMFSGLAAAAVTALACGLVLERALPDLPGVSALAHLPVIATSLALVGRGGPAIPATLIALLLGYTAYAVWRGGAIYAVLAFLTAGVLVLAVRESFDVRSELAVGLFATLMATAAIGGRLLHGGAQARPAAAARSAGGLWEIAGLAGLLLSCFLTPISVRAQPLAGLPIDGWHVALAVWILALWACVAALRGRGAGWVLVAWSFYTVAAVAAWVAPGLHSAWYAMALLVLAFAWSHARGRAYAWLELDTTAMSVVCRALFLAIPLAGVLASAYLFRATAYPTVALLLTCALAWAGETVRWRTWWAAAPAGVSAVLGAAIWGRVAAGDAAAAVGAAVVAVALAAVAAVSVRPSRERGWCLFLSCAAAATASFASPTALGHADRLAVALALVAVAWALTAVASRLPAFAGVSAVFTSFAGCAWFSWAGYGPWVTVVALSALAGALLVPRALARTEEGVGALYARVLAVTSLVVAGEVVLLGLVGRAFGAAPGPGWYRLGESGLAAALAVAGVCLVVWSVLERVEAAGYPGCGLLVAGALVQADAMGVHQAEAYLVTIAVYCAGMGVLWARRGADRRVPVATDVVAFAVGVGAPFLLSLNVMDDAAAVEHGLWALGLAAVSTALGLVTRTRVYFLGGIAVLALEALWLSRSVWLALPTWVWIGLLGLALIAGGVTFARRELLQGATRRISEGLSDWR